MRSDKRSVRSLGVIAGSAVFDLLAVRWIIETF
jgi:hypothetical protein